MIEIRNLTKRYGKKVAVSDLTMSIEAGAVTGFLGPNGAGKSTTLHILLGLSRADSGQALIDGKPFRKTQNTASVVGASLSESSVNQKLTAVQHLKLICAGNGIPMKRAHECLDITGLGNAENRAVETFSLGMKQRLGIASAIIGEPKILIMDEPFNGLDVEGIRWLRAFAKDYAASGNLVLLSSHLMSEMEIISDRVAIISEGCLIANDTVEVLCSREGSSYIRVQAEDSKQFSVALEKAGACVKILPSWLEIRNLSMRAIGLIAKTQKIALYELTEVRQGLEQVFVELTREKQGEASK